MTKEEICQHLCDVCNTLNGLTVTGIQNAAGIVGCHRCLEEVLSFLLGCEIIPPDQTKTSSENGGK